MERRTLSLRDKPALTLGDRTLVMGILNCTPDSFYPESRNATVAAALDRARTMADEGADIIDVGGESTRPGSAVVPVQEEIERVIPVIQNLRSEDGAGRRVAISVDTRKSEVARAALVAGADIVNDVSALAYDEAMAAVIAEAGVPVVLMHMRGTPLDMQQHANYVDVIEEVLRELSERTEHALSAGIRPDNIILDPGIGFAKNAKHNLALLRAIPGFKALGYPLLVGASRKSFLGAISGADAGAGPLPPSERLAGSLAVAAYAAIHGADIIRVHDVRETVHLLAVLEAIDRSESDASAGRGPDNNEEGGPTRGPRRRR